MSIADCTATGFAKKVRLFSAFSAALCVLCVKSVRGRCLTQSTQRAAENAEKGQKITMPLFVQRHGHMVFSLSCLKRGENRQADKRA
jgi:hypothetical protein